MSKEKQIEEMACAICGNSKICCGEGIQKCLLFPQMRRCANNAYKEGYRKQSEWISVDERLPSEDERRDEYGELVPFLVCEKYTKYPYRAFYDGTIWGDGLMKIKGITHWMPLPEPPKMKGGAE